MQKNKGNEEWYFHSIFAYFGVSYRSSPQVAHLLKEIITEIKSYYYQK